MADLAAMYFVPAGFEIGGEKLMGRQVANLGLMGALARAAGDEPIPCYVGDRAHGEAFDQMMRQAAPNAKTTTILRHQLARLREPGCVFVPDPGLRDIARLRLSVGWRSFSLCGVTHTTASKWALDQISDLVIEPLAPWDALICTSRAVRDTTRQLIEERSEYLQWRLGACRPWIPQLPLIPLGVDCDAMRTDPAEREHARQDLDIQPDEIVFLFVGRLSFHAKANPIPMLRALGAAAAQGRKLRLIQCGWFAKPSVRKLYEEAAAALCPNVPIVYLDGRDADTRRSAWAAADVFTSLVDNIQETFGLTPIEAMAAGLPVVVSDWDGYRDTVRHRTDGYRIRTTTPSPGGGQAIADAYADGRLNYDFYCGVSSQFAAVDLDDTIAVYGRLADDIDLRRRLGAAGQRRAREVYDWSVIAGQYKQLWAELAERRRADPTPERRSPPRRYPTQLDPFTLFRSYPSRSLRGADIVALREGERAASLEPMVALRVVDSTRALGITDDEARAILVSLEKTPTLSVDKITAAFPEPRRAYIRRGIVWLAKLGLVKITRPS